LALAMKLDIDRQGPGRSELSVDENVDLTEAPAAPDSVSVGGLLQVENLESRILLSGTLEAECRVECDLCLESFDLVFEVPLALIVIRDANGEDESDAWVIYQMRGEADLSEALREAVLIALPQKLVCRQDCLGLCPECGVNRNHTSCHCRQVEVDPRWNGLPD
jgi:uncharacterized protein